MHVKVLAAAPGTQQGLAKCLQVLLSLARVLPVQNLTEAHPPRDVPNTGLQQQNGPIKFHKALPLGVSYLTSDLVQADTRGSLGYPVWLPFDPPAMGVTDTNEGITAQFCLVKGAFGTLKSTTQRTLQATH